MAKVSTVPHQTITKRYTFSNARDNVRHSTTTTPASNQGIPVTFSITAGGSGYSASDNVSLTLNTPASGGGTEATGMTITVGGGAVTGVTNPNSNGRGYRTGDILNVVGGNSDATVTVDAVQYTMGQVPDNAILDTAIIDCTTPFAVASSTGTIAMRIGTGAGAGGGLNKTIKTANHDATPWSGEQFQDDILSKTVGVHDVIVLITNKQCTAGDATLFVNYYQGV